LLAFLYYSFCTFVSTKVPKTPTQKEGMGGKLPLTNRYFGGFQYAAKITITAVGLSRPVAA